MDGSVPKVQKGFSISAHTQDLEKPLFALKEYLIFRGGVGEGSQDWISGS